MGYGAKAGPGALGPEAGPGVGMENRPLTAPDMIGEQGYYMHVKSVKGQMPLGFPGTPNANLLHIQGTAGGRRQSLGGSVAAGTTGAGPWVAGADTGPSAGLRPAAWGFPSGSAAARPVPLGPGFMQRHKRVLARTKPNAVPPRYQRVVDH